MLSVAVSMVKFKEGLFRVQNIKKGGSCLEAMHDCKCVVNPGGGYSL